MQHRLRPPDQLNDKQMRLLVSAHDHVNAPPAMDPLLDLLTGPPLLESAGLLASPRPIFHSVLLVIATLAVVWLVRVAWPSPHRDLLWTDPPATAREHIRRLILPAEAIRLRKPAEASSLSAPTATPAASLSKRSGTTVVQRVSTEAARIAAGMRSPTSRAAPSASAHCFSYDSSSPFAHECTPLLVFVNPTSGGRQGQETLAQLRALLTEPQVVDLSLGKEHVDEALESFRTVSRFRVLVCGGDGTVGWVLSLLDSLHLDYVPPVALLPLGTGNDLARALGWGGGHRRGGGPSDLATLLGEVERAQVTLLDRWQVRRHSTQGQTQDTLGDGTPPALDQTTRGDTRPRRHRHPPRPAHPRDPPT